MLIHKSIPQYDLGHLDKVMQIQELSPNNLSILLCIFFGSICIRGIFEWKSIGKYLFGIDIKILSLLSLMHSLIKSI